MSTLQSLDPDDTVAMRTVPSIEAWTGAPRAGLPSRTEDVRCPGPRSRSHHGGIAWLADVLLEGDADLGGG